MGLMRNLTDLVEHLLIFISSFTMSRLIAD